MRRSIKFWDRIAEGYDDRAEPEEWSYIRTIELTKKYLSGNDRVLDFACGTGTMSCEIAAEVQTVHGIDISSKMIEIANRKARERQIENVTFSQGDLFDTRHEQGSYDVIFAFNILHLLEDPGRVLQRINALLKPGGIFISSTACMAEIRSIQTLFLILLSKLGVVPYLNSLRLSDVDDLLANGDFQPVESEKFNQDPKSYLIVARKI